MDTRAGEFGGGAVVLDGVVAAGGGSLVDGQCSHEGRDSW